MSTAKPEINLEISAGFFRITAQDAIYNITVIDSGQGKVSQVVEHILAQEKRETEPESANMETAELMQPEGPAGEGQENFYKQLSTDVYNDIGRLAKSLSSTMMDIPAEDRRMKRAELDEAGEKIEDAKRQLRDIVSMTEKATMEIMDQVEKVQGQTDDVKELLSQLKDHAAFKAAEAEEAAAADETVLNNAKELYETLAKSKELVAALQEPGEEAHAEPEPAPPPIQVEKKQRLLFDIDTVFQTIYELCTNETVKGHISKAREQAGEIFDKDGFVDAMTEKAEALEADADNFYTFPLSDVLQSLSGACSEKKIQNLLAKMDGNQAEIFLDQSLPLEKPAAEEVETEIADLTAAEEPAPTEVPPVCGKRCDELSELIETGLSLAASLQEGLANQKQDSAIAGMSMMSMEDQQEIFNKIENAFNVAMGICEDVTKITEALSFQDLSGQQILKIIKLLGDFQVQLLAIVVTFGSQLKSKEKNATITVEESKRLAQEEVDRYLGTTVEAVEEGPLDQETVNRMLEEMGF